jgi:HlyD family secretion protein
MAPKPRGRRRWLLGLLVVAIAAAVAVWLLRGAFPSSLERLLGTWAHGDRLPEGFISTNGRLEATEIDVATKLPGRILAVLAQEGDTVAAQAVLARLDTASLEAQLRQTRAEAARVEHEREYARALVVQREGEQEYAERELGRLQDLLGRKHVSVDQVDQARTQAKTAQAALRAARIKVLETEAAIASATAQIDRIAVDITEGTLRAPRRGRVLYRLAEPGEVLGVGGKVLTLLDLSDVYMVLFLPETVAGRVAVGAEVRLQLDAAPEYLIPAHIDFVAPRAQFTPKQVETRTEREKLVFRAKARIDPALLTRYEPLVKSGLPGVATLRLDPGVPWPEWLAPKLPPWPDPSRPSPD